MNDLRRFGWPLERVTRVHAQLAAVTLDVRYKHSPLRRRDRLRPPCPHSHFRRRSRLRSCPLSPLPPMA
eukprot:13152260-Alexandrium_andersonii.AAC.1